MDPQNLSYLTINWIQIFKRIQNTLNCKSKHSKPKVIQDYLQPILLTFDRYYALKSKIKQTTKSQKFSNSIIYKFFLT